MNSNPELPPTPKFLSAGVARMLNFPLLKHLEDYVHEHPSKGLRFQSIYEENIKRCQRELLREKRGGVEKVLRRDINLDTAKEFLKTYSLPAKIKRLEKEVADQKKRILLLERDNQELSSKNSNLFDAYNYLKDKFEQMF